jgi:very-short-patch-repair endonuclease
MRGPSTVATERARALRRRSTRAELLLWRHLRDRQLNGFKFVRQEPIGPYVADFVCRDLHLVVEIDGSQHADSTADRKRDAMLRKLGYRTIRVWNSDVLGNIDGVLQTLKSELETAPHPVPLPARGERGLD